MAFHGYSFHRTKIWHVYSCSCVPSTKCFSPLFHWMEWPFYIPPHTHIKKKKKTTFHQDSFRIPLYKTLSFPLYLGIYAFYSLSGCDIEGKIYTSVHLILYFTVCIMSAKQTLARGREVRESSVCEYITPSFQGSLPRRTWFHIYLWDFRTCLYKSLHK